MNRLVHHLIAQLKQAQVIDTAQAAVLALLGGSLLRLQTQDHRLRRRLRTRSA